MDAPEPQSHTDGKLLRPYACTYAPCHKSFSRRSDLVRHVRIHTNERPYKCEFKSCGKCFIQRSALTVHMRTHTGERPHVCEQCGRAFSDSSSLARHRRVHTGKRPYRCPFIGCDKTFCRKTTLMKHHKSHSDDNISFHSDSGSPKSTSALQSTSTSPSCVTSFNAQYANSGFLHRVPQNMQSAPASSQSFPPLPHPSSYAPPWSSTSATFSSASPSQSETSLVTSTSYPTSLQSHNFLLPVISPQPTTALNCGTFFGRHLSQSQPFPQIDRTLFNHPEPYPTTSQYVPDTQELYRHMTKPRDNSGTGPDSQLSGVLDHTSFLGSFDMNSHVMVEPAQGNPTDLLYNPFPEQMSNNHSAIPGIDLQNNFSSIGNRQHQFGTIQQAPPLPHFGFEDPLEASVEDINSCWQRLNWNRN
ncbi:hypothetical protein PCANC_15065 [Puccinia coronata f. sp. avenae]|uniref:C2H2-type domain-containing protein n=1 Tax=Puccinia coronata f. sp. avenae TaxID=200324 RepID=A0A2N5TLV7_9BASI|nr:hypothetical protein PCASD_19652 [Puccinia coronata f. sp. avenae]PLW34725.1 hypothetical protein PCANC_15065 [Puccinia coronata f. sp. avenae]